MRAGWAAAPAPATGCQRPGRHAPSRPRSVPPRLRSGCSTAAATARNARWAAKAGAARSPGPGRPGTDTTTSTSAWCANPERRSGAAAPAPAAAVLLRPGVGAGTARLRLAVATVARLALAARLLAAAAPLGRLGVHAQRLAGLEAGHRFHRSEEHTSELQSREKLVCRLLLEKK